MAWIWWLLAPLASTVAGAGALGWRARREVGSTRRGRDAMREHRQLLTALTASTVAEPVPVTMLVLGEGD